MLSTIVIYVKCEDAVVDHRGSKLVVESYIELLGKYLEDIFGILKNYQ